MTRNSARWCKRALTANNDLRAALAHYDSANALLREAKFDRYPTVTMSTSVGRQKYSAFQAFGYPRNNRFFNPGINASRELDFFGRVRHSIEAERQQTLADASDLAAMQVTVVGDVASTYIDLRGRQELLRVARENVENEQKTVRLVEAAYSAGRGTQFDTARTRALLETTTSRIPELLSAIALDEHRLAVLCALPPDALVSELEVARPLPDLPDRIDPGTPADLIRRRPDISASEERLHAATERIGIATADLFPRVNFAGLLGFNEFHGDTPFDGVSAVNLAALNIDWSFLDRGRVRARIAASRADDDAQLAQYQQSVLLALEDVENALVSYARSQDRDVQLQLAAKDSKLAADLASVRFKDGATGLLDLLDAQRVELQAEDAYAESHSNSASLPFYCTNRLLADGRKLFLRLQEAEDPETYALFNEESDGVMRGARLLRLLVRVQLAMVSSGVADGHPRSTDRAAGFRPKPNGSALYPLTRLPLNVRF